MKTHKAIAVLIFFLFAAGLAAQGSGVTIKVIDVQGVTTVIQAATSSSASSCNSPDFPVLKGGSRKDIDFSELEWISVLHGVPTGNDQIYIRVELTLKSGELEEYDMIKNIRFSGQSEQGDFTIQVKDISTVQIMHNKW